MGKEWDPSHRCRDEPWAEGLAFFNRDGKTGRMVIAFVCKMRGQDCRQGALIFSVEDAKAIII